MERDRPDWQPFDPDDPAVQLPERVASGDSGILSLVVAAGAEADGWSHRAAVAVARTLTAERGRLLLVDLDLERPRLHRILSLGEGEGISDAFLWGASLGRIARPAEGGFLLAPAGTVVADPAAVLTSSRWDDLVDGFTAAGATLLLYLPADVPGRDAVLERADEVILLCGADEAGSVELGASPPPVTAVLGPDGSGGAPGEPLEPGSETAETAETAEAVETADTADPAERVEPVGEVEPSAEALEGDGVAEGGGPAAEPEAPAPGSREEEEAVPAAGEEQGGAPAAALVGQAPEPASHPTPEVEEERRRQKQASPAPLGDVPGLPEGRRKSSSGNRVRILVLVLVLVVAAAAMAALYGLVEIPGITPLQGDGPGAGSGSAAAVAQLAR